MPTKKVYMNKEDFEYVQSNLNKFNNNFSGWISEKINEIKQSKNRVYPKGKLKKEKKEAS